MLQGEKKRRIYLSKRANNGRKNGDIYASKAVSSVNDFSHI